MKKIYVTGIILIFSLVFLPACAKKPAAPEAGTAKIEDMLNLIPKEAKAVFAIDFHRAMKTEIAEKAIKEEKSYKDYQKFVEETGIDPKEDIYFLVGAVTEGMEQKKQKGVVLLNLKYDKEVLLAKVKKEEGELREENYDGITIFSAGEDEDKPKGAFLDESNIIIGSGDEIKAVIDIFHKKGENIFKNEGFASLIKQTNKEAIFWAAILFPPEALKQATAQNPMLKPLESVKAGTLYFDYKNKNIMAEIKIMSDDEAQNQQIVDLLSGLKAMGAMAATKDPNVGELLNKIDISSTPDFVKIYANVPEELINKLKSKVTPPPPPGK